MMKHLIITTALLQGLVFANSETHFPRDEVIQKNLNRGITDAGLLATAGLIYASPVNSPAKALEKAALDFRAAYKIIPEEYSQMSMHWVDSHTLKINELSARIAKEKINPSFTGVKQQEHLRSLIHQMTEQKLFLKSAEQELNQALKNAINDGKLKHSGLEKAIKRINKLNKVAGAILTLAVVDVIDSQVRIAMDDGMSDDSGTHLMERGYDQIIELIDTHDLDRHLPRALQINDEPEVDPGSIRD